MTIQWPLVLYSLFIGIAVGPFAVAALTKALDHRQMAKWTAALALGTVVLGGIASFSHLGQPLRAVYVLGNLRSGMALEALATVITGLVAVVFCLQAFAGLWTKAQRTVAWVGLVSAVVSVWLTGSSYVLPARPFWNSPLLPLTFLASAAVLGSLAMIVVSSFALRGSSAKQGQALSRQLSRWALAALVVYGVVVLLYVLVVGANDGITGRVLAGDLALLFWLGVVIAGVVAPLALTALGGRSGAKSASFGSLMMLALVLVIIGGVAVRALLFALGGRVPLL